MAKIKATTASKLWAVSLGTPFSDTVLYVLGRDARVAARKAIDVSGQRYSAAPIKEVKYKGTLDA